MTEKKRATIDPFLLPEEKKIVDEALEEAIEAVAENSTLGRLFLVLKDHDYDGLQDLPDPEEEEIELAIAKLEEALDTQNYQEAIRLIGGLIALSIIEIVIPHCLVKVKLNQQN